MHTARSAVLEIADGGKYYTQKKYDLILNGDKLLTADRVITDIYGLKPDSDCSVSVCPAGSSEPYCSISLHTDDEFVTLDVRDFGAHGDGITDDTPFIQAAILACPENSRVLIPAGIYPVTPLFLKSGIRLELAKGCLLSASVDRSRFPVLPGLIQSFNETDEYNLASWEGNPLDCYASVINGIGISNVTIYGEGTIDGNASDDSWWHPDIYRKAPFRPRLLFLNRCHDVTVQGLNFCNSPSWTIHPYFSRSVHFYGCRIQNPAISPNTDGIDPESCTDVDIIGVHFSLGDDCIAVKSGKIYMGRKYRTPARHTLIRQCLMENGHGAVTLGSEASGGIYDLTVRDCIFRNTDRGLRIKTRRGRGADFIIDNVSFSDIDMYNVLTPLTANSFYFCDPDGHTSYVQSHEYMPADERTPHIRCLRFKNLSCTGCSVAAAWFEGLPESRIEEIIMENIHMSFAAECIADVPIMSDSVKPCCRAGMYFANVRSIIMKNVTVDGQDGKAYTFVNVDEVAAHEDK